MIRRLLALLLLGTLVGCAPTQPKTETEVPVKFLSDRAAKAVEIASHRAERLPSGHVDVLLICTAKTKKSPVWLDWKVVFYDRRGVPVEESEWHTEQIFPKIETVLRASSIRQDIENFRFLIRLSS